MRRFLPGSVLVTAVALVPGPALAQAGPEVAADRVPPPPAYSVSRTSFPIKVDGVLDDAGWQAATPIGLDWEWTPGDNTVPPVRTECRLTFDDQQFYLGCQAFDPRPEEIRAQLIDRDDTSRLVQQDHLMLLIDPFNDERRAFQFRVNPLGVQADAFLSEAEGFEDFSWDAIWNSAARRNPEGWAAEVAIPFKSLRFPRTDEVMTWGIDIGRSWPRSVRRRFRSAASDRNRSCILCQANKVTGFQGIAPGRNLEFTPTLTGSRTDARAPFPGGPMVNGPGKGSPGVDLRWGITPNLTLNATANPDFSQVEADVAQLDVNTRFALFFPEKRPFFLEGADFFETPVNAVFTRTAADPDAGLKLTGKVGGSSASAFGLFGVRDDITNLLFPSNQGSGSVTLEQEAYTTVGRFRRDIGQGSYIGALYTGRYGAGYANTVGGVDLFQRLGRSNAIRAQYLVSNTEYPDSVATAWGQPGGTFTGGGLNASFQHASARWVARASYRDMSPDFRADAGFVSRVDVRTVAAEFGRVIRQSQGWFTQLMMGGFAEETWNHQGNLTDRIVGAFTNYEGPLQSTVGLHLYRARERFLDTDYDLTRYDVSFSLKPSGALSLSVEGSAGDAIDFSNARPSDLTQLSSSAQLSLGRGLGLDLRHVIQRLDFDGDEVFTANLLQTTLKYQFNVRTFVRGIVQYRQVDRNITTYSAPVTPQDESVFSQFLFSYKVNPQTVMFVGYSGNWNGTDQIDLTSRNRTLFAKLGYAWRP